MQDKITIADAPDCLNTNDKAMWVLGYQAALAARSTCLHQIQEPAAAEQAAWHAGLDEGRAQAAPAAVAVPDERAAFEAWAKSEDMSIGSDCDGYIHSNTAAASLAWQARAALAATPAANSVELHQIKTAAPVVLPEPDFQLKWSASAGRYSFSKPLTGDVDCYTADTVRALLATATGLPAQATETTHADFEAWWGAAGDGRSKMLAKRAWTAATRAAAPQAQADARDAESDYQRGYRHGYNRRDAEVQGALL